MPEQQPKRPSPDGSDELGRSDELGPERPRRLRPSGSDPVAHYKAYARWLEHSDPAVVANTLLCLIHQANYLLDQQISALERDFVQDGGYSEQLAEARLAARQKQDQTDPSGMTDQSGKKPKAPACPQCGKPMALRTARKGQLAGSQFWGCSGYPECKGTRPLEGSDGTNRPGGSKGKKP